MSDAMTDAAILIALWWGFVACLALSTLARRSFGRSVLLVLALLLLAVIYLWEVFHVRGR